MSFIPHVMCQRCEHVFASDATLEDTVQCPECGCRATPKRVMRPSGFPSLEAFKRNWQRATGNDRDA
jgi:DNA-directed RNA polymerase subunit RPC12/RpoP